MTAPLTKLGRILRGLDGHPEDRCRTVAEVEETVRYVRAAGPLTAEETEDVTRLKAELAGKGGRP